MPIKIHYGPPGSYKTAGAMTDDFLREAKSGRVIVTNVRGVTRQRCLDLMPDLPASFDVICVDDKTDDGREKWAHWFHWVPKGAFIFVDEVQDIWPKRWRDADIKALDYPGGLRQATADDRPFCWDQAFDKHRHWNWDMVLTTPSYKKVRDDIKGVADAAYKHKDLALIGWAGHYIEAMHLADDTGANQSDLLTVVRKKVSPDVFKLYDSTATGQHRTNLNGFNLFKSPRVLVLLVVLGLAIYFGFGRGDIKIFPGAAVSPPAAAGSASVPGAPSGRSVGARDDDGRRFVPDDVTPFASTDVYIASSIFIQGRWRYAVGYANTVFTHDQIIDMGYSVRTYGSCGVQLKRGDFVRFITCGFPDETKPSSEPLSVDQSSR